jgi:electron transport complex protein RnfE
MGVATTFVLVGSGLIVSLFRKYIAHEVRITSYILIIATFVTLADLLSRPASPRSARRWDDSFRSSWPTACSSGAPRRSRPRSDQVRAVAGRIGYGHRLHPVAVGDERHSRSSRPRLTARHRHSRPRWEPWVFMVLPPGGFFTLGLL